MHNYIVKTFRMKEKIDSHLMISSEGQFRNSLLLLHINGQFGDIRDDHGKSVLENKHNLVVI